MQHYSNVRIDESQLKTVLSYDTKAKKKIEYYNIECGYDIEVTSDYTKAGRRIAYMYVWAFGLGENVYYGRTWEEFKECLNMVKEQLQISLEKRLIIYVHNLAYEFQFFRKLFNWENVFAVDKNKPIKAVTEDGFEFKDSYILSGYSLKNLAKNLTKHRIDKLDDDFNYTLKRHHETVLTSEEKNYLKNDVLIVLYYINEQINYYDNNITKIPLTNTGRVRRFVKDKCYYTDKNHKKSSRGKYIRYRELMQELTLTPDQYQQLKRCFMGGFTHASLFHVDKVLNNVTSIDFNSSYPAVMVSEKFPMSRPEAVDLWVERFETLLNNDEIGLMFDIKFINLRSKLTYESYISKSKCLHLKGEINVNGRIFKADELITTITDIDFKIIQAVYEWDYIEVANCYKFYMQYLPKAVIMSILELYEGKTALKGVKGQEVEYMISKGMLNSIYGMTVTDIVRPEIEYITDWSVTTPTEELIEEQIETYNYGKNRFLYYAWGVWVTAYARRNLWTGILNIGSDYIYSDTDSIKFLNYDKHKSFIDWYNKDLEQKLRKVCEFRKIDFSLMKPKTKDGEEKLIGVFEFDGDYSKFKTLGSKRYLVQHKDSGELQLTVAGLSKQNGLEYMKEQAEGDVDEVFNKFNDGLYIPANRTGKNTHTYINEETTVTVKDYKNKSIKVHIASAIHLEQVEFTLSISREYGRIIKDIKEGYLPTGQRAL